MDLHSVAIPDDRPRRILKSSYNLATEGIDNKKQKSQDSLQVNWVSTCLADLIFSSMENGMENNNQCVNRACFNF